MTKEIEFDYISDIHLDSWVDLDSRNLRTPISRFVHDHLVSPALRGTAGLASTLVIAGDTSHRNSATAAMVSVLLDSYYKDVVVVLGNHDLASFGTKERFVHHQDRVTDLATRLSSLPRCHLLTGSKVELGGVSYGGTVGWCDYSYSINRLGLSLESGKRGYHLWWDSRYVKMPPVGRTSYDFMEMYTEQEPVIRALAGEVDVMVTHFGPVDEGVPSKFVDSPNTGYFYFDGRPLLDRGQAPCAWVFGHTHTGMRMRYGRTDLLCNPYGYRGEDTNRHGILKYKVSNEL